MTSMHWADWHLCSLTPGGQCLTFPPWNDYESGREQEMGDRNQGDSMTTTTPSGADAAALAAAHGLAELGGRPPLTVYVRQLWERRYFAIELARSRFRAQNEA